MRTVLLGAVRSTEVALEALALAGKPPAHLLTLPPSRSARHSDYVDLSTTAVRHGVPVTGIASVRSDTSLALLHEIAPDLLLVVGWSEILPPEALAASRLGVIGYHPAPLPLMRGRAVLPWTILSGRTRSGGTLFWLAPGLDDGEIAYQSTFSLSPDEDAGSLYDKHMAALRDMLVKFASATETLEIPRRPQNHSQATFCAQRKPIDGLIDWAEPAAVVDRLVRATTRPYPGARSVLLRGMQEVVIWSSTVVDLPYLAVPGQIVFRDEEGPVVACGDGFVRLGDTTDVTGVGIQLRVQDRFLPHGPAWTWWHTQQSGSSPR